MFHLFKRSRPESSTDSIEIDLQKVPKHIAIIMDGNGRWAKRRGMPRIAGHQAGMKSVKRAVTAANDLGVQVLTLYAFSTENWKRPRDEVDFLMKLPQQFLALELDELVEKNVHVRLTGWKEGLPSHTLDAVEEAIVRTKQNNGLILNFALNYGSRHEIVTAVQSIAEQVRSGDLKPEDINESLISNHLLTKALPDPDLVIRTSGEIRISNFLLWQMAYSELWFTDIYWPEFTEQHLRQAVSEYQRRARRYGAL